MHTTDIHTIKPEAKYLQNLKETQKPINKQKTLTYSIPIQDDSSLKNHTFAVL